MHSKNIIHAKQRKLVFPKRPRTADAFNVLISLNNRSNEILSISMSDNTRNVSAVNLFFTSKVGELKLDIGDFQCKFCQWSALCYSETPDAFANAKKQIQTLYNIPKDIILVTELKEAKENIDLI